jgi:hypothetical protein
MKRLAVGILSLYILFSACSGSGTKEAISPTDHQKTSVKPFSDSLYADTFQVRIEGSKPKEMQLIFTIRSFKAKEIYRASIKAEDLFKNYNATIDLGKKNNQIKFLKEEMNRFFDEENFLEPAVTESETPDEHVPDKSFYKELKNNHLNGFIYRLGRENKIYIAWSASEKKVKPYYICCK